MRKVLTFILAGGKGERLNPLTRDRAKPAVPFGGKYRIIDFTLSNCVNSDLRRIYVLIQYKSFSLQKHILAGWDIVSTQLGEFIDVIPAQQRISSDWYLGTADAIHQNSYTIMDHQPDMVLILAGDHVYKMDYQKMIDFHQQMQADLTLACSPQPVAAAPHFGVLEVDKKNRIRGFQEKPSEPKTIPGDPGHIFASMGIYLFQTDVLLQELREDAQLPSQHDFGKNIIPQMLKNKKKVFVYNFTDKHGSPVYWRDIGTRDAYYEAHMDLVSSNPPIDLYDRQWPVRTFHEPFPPVRMKSVQESGGRIIEPVIKDSLVADGCIINGAKVTRSVLSSHINLDSHSEVVNSVLMEGVTVGENAKIQNAIIDKEVHIPANASIGFDLDRDRQRFDVTTSGIVIVAKKTAVGLT